MGRDKIYTEELSIDVAHGIRRITDGNLISLYYRYLSKHMEKTDYYRTITFYSESSPVFCELVCDAYYRELERLGLTEDALFSTPSIDRLFDGMASDLLALTQEEFRKKYADPIDVYRALISAGVVKIKGSKKSSVLK